MVESILRIELYRFQEITASPGFSCHYWRCCLSLALTLDPQIFAHFFSFRPQGMGQPKAKKHPQLFINICIIQVNKSRTFRRKRFNFWSKTTSPASSQSDYFLPSLHCSKIEATQTKLQFQKCSYQSPKRYENKTIGISANQLAKECPPSV